MQINMPCPEFSLVDTQTKNHHLHNYLGRIVVINFWSAECPWCERTDAHLSNIHNRFHKQVSIISVASNLNETLEFIEQVRQQRIEAIPVLVDVNCQLANAWEAITTPHAFVIDTAGILRYKGAIDDVTFRNRSPDHYYIEEAVLARLACRTPDIQETQPYGCTIVRET